MGRRQDKEIGGAPGASLGQAGSLGDSGEPREGGRPPCLRLRRVELVRRGTARRGGTGGSCRGSPGRNVLTWAGPRHWEAGGFETLRRLGACGVWAVRAHTTATRVRARRGSRPPGPAPAVLWPHSWGGNGGEGCSRRLCPSMWAECYRWGWEKGLGAEGTAVQRPGGYRGARCQA